MIIVLPTIALDSDPADVPIPGTGQLYVFFTPDGTLNAKKPDGTTVQLTTAPAAAPGAGTFTLPVGFPPGGLISADEVGDLLDVPPGTVGSVLCVVGPGSLGWRDLATAVSLFGLGEAPENGAIYARSNGAWVVVGGGLVDAPDDGQEYLRSSGAWVPISVYLLVDGYAKGDMLYAGADGNLAVLHRGGAGQVLTVTAGGLLAWVTPATSTSGGGGEPITGTGGGGGGGVWDVSAGVPSLASFTQVDPHATAVFVENPGKALVIQMATPGTAAPNIVALSRPAPATPYRVSIFVAPCFRYQDYNGLSFGFHDPASNHFDEVHIQNGPASTSGLAVEVDHENYSGPAARGAYSSLGYLIPLMTGPYWIHLGDDGTTLTWAYSLDGATPRPLLSIPKAGGYLGAGAYSNIFVGMLPDTEVGGNFQGNALTIWCYDESGLSRVAGV